MENKHIIIARSLTRPRQTFNTKQKFFLAVITVKLKLGETLKELKEKVLCLPRGNRSTCGPPRETHRYRGC